MEASAKAPHRIEPLFVERVWGRTDLAPLFGTFDKRVGEVWFPLGPDAPLLVKFIFTDQKLSVQVHPDDEYAAEHEKSRGKTEMWHILAVQPGGTIALGFRRELGPEELRTAILDGSIEQHLNIIPVAAGETYYVPAGVVHAIGAGVTLCEIQQNSDVTYRLYDYGRPRQLHLERGIEVTSTAPYDGLRELPIESEHFTTELVEGNAPDLEPEHLLIVLSGNGTIDDKPFEAGQLWMIPAGTRPHILTDDATRFLRARSSDAARSV